MSIYLSASLINDYLKCNKIPYYRIHHPELAMQNREMIIGEIVHKTLEVFWKDEEAARGYSEKEILSRLPDDKSALKHTEDCLQTFFHEFRQLVTDNDKVEKRFKIPIEPNVFLVGKMDRIVNDSLFDWKTARRPPKDVADDPQFIIYNWAFKELLGYEASGVYYAALSNGALIKYRYDRVLENVLFSEVIPQVISSLRRGEYTANGVFRGSCFRCSYSESCLKELSDGLDSTASS